MNSLSVSPNENLRSCSFICHLPLNNQMVHYMLIYSIVYSERQIMKKMTSPKDTDITLFLDDK